MQEQSARALVQLTGTTFNQLNQFKYTMDEIQRLRTELGTDDPAYADVTIARAKMRAVANAYRECATSLSDALKHHNSDPT